MDIQNDDDDDDDVVPVFLILKYPSILFQMELYCHDLQVRCWLPHRVCQVWRGTTSSLSPTSLRISALWDRRNHRLWVRNHGRWATSLYLALFLVVSTSLHVVSSIWNLLFRLFTRCNLNCLLQISALNFWRKCFHICTIHQIYFHGYHNQEPELHSHLSNTPFWIMQNDLIWLT